MYHRFWSYLFYLYGLVAQVIWPCEEPAKISAGSLNTAEYFGSWYFIAAAGESDSDLQIFKHMDNTLFDLQGADIPERLLLQGAIKVGNHCVEKNWVYYIHHYRDDLELEGRPLMKSYIFESDCKDCIIMMETQDKGEHQFKRMMLYAHRTFPEESSLRGDEGIHGVTSGEREPPSRRTFLAEDEASAAGLVKAFANPEDSPRHGGMKFCLQEADVERYWVHHNDMECIYPFLFIGTLYCMLDDSPSIARLQGRGQRRLLLVKNTREHNRGFKKFSSWRSFLGCLVLLCCSFKMERVWN
ncbi:APOM protein, partial [Polyodon spathula]|nr:APOM protein [Polyodon spathula]